MQIRQYLDRAAKERMLALLREKNARRPIWQPLPGPQTMAYESRATITGYGGAAGGGKTDLIAGLTTTKHKRALIIRKEKAQTEGVIQRLTEISGGAATGYNSMRARWNYPMGSEPLIEFGGLDNPGDERRWQGRPHDLKAFDEVTEMREDQVRFCMGWRRSDDPTIQSRILMTFNPPTTVEGRWVIKFFAPWLDKQHPRPAMPGELRWFTTIKGRDVELPDDRAFVLVADAPSYDFEPRAYKPEDIIRPESRTFIPARLTDNPYYMRTGYMSTLQSLPEPLRSQMLYGDFLAGVEDDAFQLIPTTWVEAAQKRWKELDVKPEMSSLGIDVARGGRDSTIIVRRHTMWFDRTLAYPGSTTPDGPTVAGLTIAATRDNAPQHIDVIGVGSSPYDFLNSHRQQVMGVNVAEKALGTDQSGRLGFINQRSELGWRLREAFDPANNTGIAVPPEPEILAELCAPKWKLSGAKIQVEGRDDIIKRVGHSPDRFSAYCLALIDTPKRTKVEEDAARRAREGGQFGHDPYASRKTHDPYA